MALFQGEAKKYSITIKSGGDVVDPETLENVKIWLYDRVSGETIAQWALENEDGFIDAEIVGNSVVFYLDDDQTINVSDGKAIIQVTVYDKYPGGQDMICTKKGVFATTKTAKV